ncbi:glycosyltransferase [Geomonas agri]|uniref:glycosyltransferase n=1 Tax=Geomonas agri TaxID=2873702 RepID=UPI001CD5F43B|nr:glycosyltransferase [Geomonas agri]
MRVVHIITGLGIGGAEMMLYKFIANSDLSQNAFSVISLTDKGAIGSRLEALGVPVFSLGLRRFPSPYRFLKLCQLIRKLNPDIVQTWLYHADLIGGGAAKISCSAPVIWNIHNGVINNNDKLTTRAIAKISAWISGLIPTYIVYVASSSCIFHTKYGYCGDISRVIPNGFDTSIFFHNPDSGNRFRDTLGIKEDAIVIGLIARYDPQKDHHNLLLAVKALISKYSNLKVVLCGDRIDSENTELISAIERNGLVNVCYLLGRQGDIPMVINSCDIVASSSCSEAFPLVVGEAMSCCVPCAVTDVGDSAFLVGDTGRVVPPHDPNALALALDELILLGRDGRRELGGKARQRILDKFSLHSVIREYNRLYTAAVDDL